LVPPKIKSLFPIQQIAEPYLGSGAALFAVKTVNSSLLGEYTYTSEEYLMLFDF